MDGRMWSRRLMVSVSLAMIICIVGAVPRKPRLGSAINMLDRYGRLAKNMRVMAGTVRDTWIYGEPSVGVFKPYSPEFTSLFFGQSAVLVSFNVQIKFCSNFQELINEYFSGFKIAGVDESFRAFSNDWSEAAVAKLFGIDESFVANNYSYVFLKIARSRDTKRMFGFIEEYEIEEAVVERAKYVEINDTASADKFISQFGTHYVSSFATGDFIYQVFVDTPSYLRYLKQHISRTGLQGMDPYERDLMFSPWHTLHVGKILSASGSPLLESWVYDNLEGWYAKDERYWSILQIYSDNQLSQHLDQIIQDNAFLRMELEILAPVFRSPERSKWFEEHVRKRLSESIAKVPNKL